jgi:hypothetical protein
MPRITPGNRLYLYKLLSSTLGTNHQALLSRVEEALLEDGIAPQDLGQEDIQSLMEALPEFVRLTVFKKGRVYATIVPNEDYDGYLERAGQSGSGNAGEKGSKSKPWKRRKGSHDPKPTKPRHVEKSEAKQEPTPEPEAAAEPEPASAPEPEPETVAAPEPKPTPELEPEPEPETVTVPEPEPAPAPAPAPQPSPTDKTPTEPNEPQVEATEPEAREQPVPETPARLWHQPHHHL